MFSIYGFFLAYVSLLNYTKNYFNLKSITRNFLTRRIRALPLIWFCLFAYIKLIPYILDGPLSGYIFKEKVDSCTNNNQWVGVMFFYSVLTNQGYKCFNQVWIYQSEIYFFIVGGFVMYFFIKFKSRLYLFVVSGALILTSLGLKLYVILNNEFNKKSFSDLFFLDDYNRFYYFRPYLNFSDYMVGFLFGVGFFSFGYSETNEDNVKASLLKVDKDNVKYSESEEVDESKLKDKFFNVFGGR